jgi:hypothetical protein
MSLSRTKAQLLKLLADQDSKVIALSGRWGTGKTHLWGEVVAASEDERVKASLYVSLFGLSSVDQIKRKLIESAAPGIEAHPTIWEGAQKAVTAGIKALSGFHKGFEALNDLNLLLLAPAMLGEKVIVIDDIERKHEKLGIDEIMGFIDEYTQRHKSRFILILNSDQLAKKQVWDTLREKVIDEEIRLTTTPEEAFEIAAALSPSQYAEAIKTASITCGLTNIRIIRKVIKAANRILGNRDLSSAIQARVVPSIVLLSAIHYKGLIEGPDFQFVLGVGSASDWAEFARDREHEPTEEEKLRSKWRMLVRELGILGCDEFEAMVVQFLESGLFDEADLVATIDRYIAENQQMEAREKASQFLFKELWDHRISENQIIAEALELPKIAGLLDPYAATQLQLSLSEYPNGADIGQDIIDRWIESFRANPPPQVSDDNPFNRPLHPSIKAAFAAINAKAQDRLTVVDACTTIIEQSGWGAMEEMAMRRATVADFESAIREMDVDSLRKFMRRMIEMSLQPQAYKQHFGDATDRFVSACRLIANDQNSPRLARLVRALFAKTALAPRLEQQDAVGQSPTAQG